MAQTGISIWKYPNMRGPNRGDRPEILFEINSRADRLDKTPVPLWYQDGTLVLDQDNSPVRVFDLISAVCSSQIEGWLMVAILHTDNRLRIGVIRARIHEAMEGIHEAMEGGAMEFSDIGCGGLSIAAITMRIPLCGALVLSIREKAESLVVIDITSLPT